MKRIDNQLGVLGLGSRSTLFYLKELNTAYQIEMGGFSTFPLILLNTNFDKINQLLPYSSSELDAIVLQYLNKFEAFGVNKIIVPNITLHETIDRLGISSEIIHPIHLTITQIKKAKINQIVLFASIFTMQSSYIKDLFERENIEVILPHQEEMLFIDHVRKMVYLKKESKETIAEYNVLIDKYSKINFVVIACTELSILTNPKNDRIIDMAFLQIQSAINQFSS